MGGISLASFYAAFDSKDALYGETLDAYLRGHGMVMAALRDESLSPRDRLEQALRRSAVMHTEAEHPTGCMVMVRTALFEAANIMLTRATRFSSLKRWVCIGVET